LEIFAPVIYEVGSNEIRPDCNNLYELVNLPGKIEDLNDDEKKIVQSAHQVLSNEISKIKDKIRADIQNVRVEIEEMALEKKRREIEKRITKINEKLGNLRQEINRKQERGIRCDKEKEEYRKLIQEFYELKEKLREVSETGIPVEFGEEKIIGGCLYTP